MPREKHIGKPGPEGGRIWFSGVRVYLLIGIVSLAIGGRESVRGADGPVSKEYQIKAAFLYSFTKFVDWPAARFIDPKTPIVIGVLGENPFGEELDKVVQNRKVNGRDFVVKRIDTPSEARSTHVLFVEAGEEHRFAEIGTDGDYFGVLTVGESKAFIALGGVISFLMVEDNVRFEISIKAADLNGLKISAQLQKLAARVLRNQ